MRHAKFRFIVAVLVFLALVNLPGCAGSSANATLQTSIDEGGAGFRILSIYVPSGDLQQVQGGSSGIEAILKSAMPQGLTQLGSTTDSNGVYFKFQMTFTTTEELTEKCGLVLGGNPSIQFTRGGTPFTRTYTLVDSTPAAAYFKWAETAVSRAGVLPGSLGGAPLSGYSNYVLLPGDSQWRAVSSAADWRATSVRQHPVDQVAIETNVWRPFSRQVSITVSKDVVETIDKSGDETIAAFLKRASGLDVAVAESKSENAPGTVYSFTMSAGSLEELANASQQLFGAGRLSFTEDSEKASVLWKRYFFEDGFDFLTWLGDPVQLGRPLQYTARFKGARLDDQGQPLKTDPKILRLESANGIIQARAWVREVSVGAVAALVLIALLLVGGLAAAIIIGRKKGWKFRWPAGGRPATPRAACPMCGFPVEADDKFCYSCGQPLVACPTCGKCRRTGAPEDMYCYWCGEPLTQPGAAAEVAPAKGQDGQKA